MSNKRFFHWVLTVGALLVASTSHAQTTVGAAQAVTWTCTSSPCPWGPTDSGRALVWPASMGAITNRLGYTVSAGIYAPAAAVNGIKIKITSGHAEFYAGTPGASSHRFVDALDAGETLTISDIATGEVLSVQNASAFNYEINPVTPPPTPPPSNGASGSSQSVTWTCVGSSSNCPWGSSTTGLALVWQSGLGATASRLGYTVSQAIYLPASVANTRTIKITAGTATLYAGQPNAASHRGLITLTVGESYAVTGLASGEVLSVQGSIAFQYAVSVTTTTPPPPASAHNSQLVTWNCTSSPCPWGSTDSGQALVWPASAGAISSRLGYTTSAAIYLTSNKANGTKVKVNSGTVTLYAGEPGAASHRALVTLTGGDATYTVSGILSGEVLSVQGSAAFTYDVTVGTGGGTTPPPDTGETGHNGLNSSTKAFWRCDIPSCWSADWVGAVIHWPAGKAYANNARHADESRTVFNAAGQKLYPYMGRWAEGCKVAAVTGEVLIIEWERGTDTWRQTTLLPGQSHTIHLVGSENGAMIETSDTSPFSATLTNCNPQTVP